MLKRFDEFGRDLYHGPVVREVRDARLRCALCRTTLARTPERVARLGAHEHRCVNPLGMTFEIGCFGGAENVRFHGDAVLADTWFPGYTWQVLACGHCDAHVGWHFRARGDEFCGLILSSILAD